MRKSLIARAAAALMLCVLALSPASAASAEGGGKEAPAAREARRELKFSKHALSRMAERGVSRERVSRILKTAEPFQYYHQGSWKTGYYDRSSDIFVALSDGLIITVITNATPRYVEKLKRAKP